MIEVDDYDVQPEPKKAPESKENNKQEKDISEKAVKIEKPTLTETELEALYQVERAQCKYVFSKKLMLLRLVYTARFDHPLKERQVAAWDERTLQYLHVILTFMRYVAAKGAFSDDFRNAFRADQIAGIFTRILRLYNGSKRDYWHEIHSHSFPRFEMEVEFPREGNSLMNTPFDEVLFGEVLPSKEESPDNGEKVPLHEKKEGKGLKDQNREEGELLTVNIEKAKTPDDKAKEAQSAASKNPDPQKEECESQTKVLKMELCIHKVSSRLTTLTWNEETGSTRT
ncbi:hypothetical protein B0O99DRAFT_695200 [Bisporella sp. PMI_857]|nr:hypothetical protein B0O99DRAFT_695200 [Bisporella sp. PMI_857]